MLLWPKSPPVPALRDRCSGSDAAVHFQNRPCRRSIAHWTDPGFEPAPVDSWGANYTPVQSGCVPAGLRVKGGRAPPPHSIWGDGQPSQTAPVRPQRPSNRFVAAGIRLPTNGW